MTTTITTTKEQAEQIKTLANDPKENRQYWQIVADVMGIDRDANFVWNSEATSSNPNKDMLVITVTK